MRIGLELKIDVTKIDKSKLFKGAKGTYLNITTFVDVDEQDQYGNNGMVTQSQTKEESAQGIKSAILGNNKVFWTDQPQQQQQMPPAPAGGTQGGSDIPF